MERHFKECKESKESTLTLNVWKCTECNAEYQHLSSLQRHNREKHSFSRNGDGDRPSKRRRTNMGSEAVFECDLCFKTFSSSNALGGHKSAAHRDRKGMDCHSVRKVLNPESPRKSLALKWRCGICGDRFKNEMCLKHHELLHGTERPFKCTLCDSAFVLEGRLHTHLLTTHHVKRWECTQCGLRFTKKRELRAHICGGDGGQEVDGRESERNSGGIMGRGQDLRKERQSAVDSVVSVDSEPINEGFSIYNHRL